MAVTDDVPDGCAQHPPLSPQPYSDHKFNLSVVEHDSATSYKDVCLHDLPSRVSTSFSDGYCMAGASPKTSAYTTSSDSIPFSQSKTLYQTDSSGSSQTISNCSTNTTDTSSCSLQAAASMATGVSTGGQYGRDAFMSSEVVLQVLGMGFDYETVRNVLHLKIVQSAENYSNLEELLEAVLAYNAAMNDRSSDDSDTTLRFEVEQCPQLQQQQQPQLQSLQQLPAEMTTVDNSSSQQLNCSVSSDVTAAYSLDAFTATDVRKKPGKKKPRRNKNTATSRSLGSHSMKNSNIDVQLEAAPVSSENADLVGVMTELQMSALDADDGLGRLVEPWQLMMENRRLKESKRCKICLEADIAMVFIPCGHLVCCQGCASLVSRCCLCETSVRDSVRVYMN